MILEGQKWACQSCIRGHRVSNCTHADRELFPIAPKGRPVKQCDHCRSARKDKSHHAKCNCGGKKTRDLSDSAPKSDGLGCLCHKPGNKCVCGTKSETTDLRMQESLLRRTLPVKSRPLLDIRATSDNALVAGQSKLHHRSTLGHSSCHQPYSKPRRPVSLQAPYSSSFCKDHDIQIGSGAVDDMLLLNSGRMYGVRTDSASDLAHGFDFNNYVPDETAQLFRISSADAIASPSQPGWYEQGYDALLGTLTESPADFITSPTAPYGEMDWNIPSANTASFTPSDLPLTSGQIDFAPTISHSGESSYQSVPGLTASSSGAQSEIDGPTEAPTVDAFPSFWTGSMPYRETTSVTAALNANGVTFPSSMPEFDATCKPTSEPQRQSQTYSGGPHSHHTSYSSNCTAVPLDLIQALPSNPALIASSNLTSSLMSDQDVNIGHLQNLATLKCAQDAAARSAGSSPAELPVSETDLAAAISIPNAEDYLFDQYQIPTQQPPPDQPQSQPQGSAMEAGQFGWLLERP